MTALAEGQLCLFGEPAPTRTWSDVRKGERVVYAVASSQWRGRWTVRHVEIHPTARYLLIVDLLGEDGRRWVTWINRDTPVPGLGFRLDDVAGAAP